MMRRRDQRKVSDNRAFTLLEVLIATLIAAIVLAAMNAAFYVALHLRSVTNDLVENSIPQNHAASILKADLRGTLITGGTMAISIESPGTESGNNQPTDLDIYTTTGVLHDDLPWGDVQKVSYLLKNPTAASSLGGKDLVRAVTRNLLASTQPDLAEQPLLSGVSSVQFSFFDGANWQTTWDSTSAVAPAPQAIKVHVEFANGNSTGQGRLPLEVLVPVDGQVSSNSVATAGSITGG
jgi:prepilin-type N-terminal cleavage/methylation domain-containing protein